LKRSATLRDEKKKLQNEMTERRKAWEQHRDEKVETVGEEEIAGIVSMWTGIPSPA
jgi:ATP-dependent Clp protease ATP-binding subunit ClpC